MLISICWNGALFAAWEWSGWIAKITFPQTLPDLLDKIGHIFSYLFILLMLYGLPIYTGIIILYVMICFLWKLIKKHRAASAK